MTEQNSRLYAVNLLNRAEVAFDVRDIAVVGKVIEQLEDDIADWLSAQFEGSQQWQFNDRIVTALRDETWRPELPQPRYPSASLESNLK